jgi:small subunit ribosomal protein S8
MMTDPIADMFARIRNAGLAHLDRADIPHSKIKERIAEILKEEGYLSDFRVNHDSPARITVFLRYVGQKQNAIAGLRRKSRPGRRYYAGFREIPTVHNGMGIAIVSTSVGVMTDRQAREKKVGGEVLAEVW